MISRFLSVLASLVLWLWLTGCSTPRSTPAPSLYQRVHALLASRPDLTSLDEPPAELARVNWMLGDWEIETSVLATAGSTESKARGSAVISRVLGGCWLQMQDTYPGGTQDLGFLTYNRITRRWVSLGLDSNGNAVVSTAETWDDNRLVLDAPDVEVMGVRAHLRQVLERRNPNEFVVMNEERMPDGKWRPLDQYVYRRQNR